MLNKFFFATILSLALGVTSLANAGFLGKTVTGEHLLPDLATPVFGPITAIVGGTAEFSVLDTYSADVTDSALFFIPLIDTTMVFNTAAFNGFHLFDNANNVDAITGVDLVLNGWSGFDSTRVTFDADNIWVNMQGVTAVADSIVLLGVTFLQDGGGSVPEPATLALVALGLTGIRLTRRRKA